MSDNDSTPSPGFDASNFVEKDRAFSALSNSIRPANKTVLFDALAAAPPTVARSSTLTRQPAINLRRFPTVTS
jgi:hypothetical protein